MSIYCCRGGVLAICHDVRPYPRYIFTEPTPGPGSSGQFVFRYGWPGRRFWDGPVRFLLDYLRAQGVRGADPRYLGLTPAHYAAIVVTGAGIYLCVLVARLRPGKAVSS